MAKRYVRLNWQNKPSVATAVNSTNLNKMDKGIDDLDDAVETLNNNLGAHKAESVSQVGGVHGIVDEKGTWTPVWGDAVLSKSLGYYTRINNVVYIWCELAMSSKNNAVFTIDGLPFTPSTSAEFVILNIGQIGGITFGANEQLYARVNIYNTIGLFKFISGTTIATLNNVDFTNTTAITISGFYFI